MLTSPFYWVYIYAMIEMIIRNVKSKVIKWQYLHNLITWLPYTYISLFWLSACLWCQMVSVFLFADYENTSAGSIFPGRFIQPQHHYCSQLKNYRREIWDAFHMGSKTCVPLVEQMGTFFKEPRKKSWWPNGSLYRIYWPHSEKFLMKPNRCGCL